MTVSSFQAKEKEVNMIARHKFPDCGKLLNFR